MNGFKDPLLLEELPDRKWRLHQDLTFEGREQNFTVKKGYITDLASVPFFLWWLFPPYGSYAKAAVLHDLLWQLNQKYYNKPLPARGGLNVHGQTYPKGYLLDPVDVDGMFRRAMRLLGTNFFVRWPMWWAVRTLALIKGRKGAMGLKRWSQWVAVLVSFLAPIFIIVALIAF